MTVRNSIFAGLIAVLLFVGSLVVIAIENNRNLRTFVSIGGNSVGVELLKDVGGR